MRNEPPAEAEARTAGIRASGTWGSALTSGEFAAIRSVGFEPVGQVFGAAVFGIAHGDGYTCPRITASSRKAVQARPSGQLSEQDGQGVNRDGQGPERVGHRWQEPDDEGPLGPLVRAMDQARRTAVERMTAQCAELGGDGVVGLRISRGAFLLGGQEFSAIGTAVRARGALRGGAPYGAARAAGESAGRWAADAKAGGAADAETGGAADAEAGGAADAKADWAADGGAAMLRAPFTSDLTGQDFAKLIMAGWVPAGLVFGVAIGACHDDWQTTRQTRRWSGNREVAGWTAVVNQARRAAGRRLQADVQRLGGEGAVLASMQLRVSTRDCPAQPGRRDHIIEASVLGTAVARFARADEGHGPVSPALAVLPLAPPGRQTGI